MRWPPARAQHDAGADREGGAPQQAHGKRIRVDSAFTRIRIAKTEREANLGAVEPRRHEDRGPAIPAGLAVRLLLVLMILSQWGSSLHIAPSYYVLATTTT